MGYTTSNLDIWVGLQTGDTSKTTISMGKTMENGDKPLNFQTHEVSNIQHYTTVYIYMYI